MNANEIADRLDGAAALIEERGHAKGVLVNDTGGVCLNGALNCVHHGSASFSADSCAFIDRECGPFLLAALRDGGVPVEREPGVYLLDPWVMWNNAPERTASEVCALLRKAAQLARQQAPVGVEVAHA